MKQLITLLLAIMIISSCHGQSGAVKDQQSAYKVLEDLKKKNMQPATDEGWTMTCLIDGKPWKATALYMPTAMGRIGGENGTSHVSLYDPGNYQVGYKKDFATSAVEFDPPGSKDIWGGHAGEMEITKVANGWVEGKFHFTATGMTTHGKIEVTNGFFRFATKK